MKHLLFSHANKKYFAGPRLTSALLQVRNVGITHQAQGLAILRPAWLSPAGGWPWLATTVDAALAPDESQAAG